MISLNFEDSSVSMMYSSFCPCNVDPLTPHFIIIKLGLRWVYGGGSNVYQHSMF